MTIEGIPEGWDQERVGQIHPGEYWVNNYGDPQRWENNHPSSSKNYVIIRKIEKPKQYRPFANAAEAEPFFDRRLRYKACCNAIMRMTVLGEAGIEVAADKYTYKEAFDRFECTDGTPFGIEVTE